MLSTIQNVRPCSVCGGIQLRSTQPTKGGCFRICRACNHMWHDPTRATVVRARKTTRKRTSAPPDAKSTYGQALERFRKHFAGGFQDEQYALQERAWKWSKHELWRDTVSPDGFRTLATASPEQATALIEQMIETESPMLHPRDEIVPLRDVIHQPEHAATYFTTLADLLEAPSLTPDVFDNHLQALASVPVVGSGNLATWTIVTIIPYLVQPARHMFLKPGRIDEATRRLGKNVHCSPTPTWDTYQRGLAFGNDLLEFLKPHGAQDMIDVQSFIWAITSPDEAAPG